MCVYLYMPSHILYIWCMYLHICKYMYYIFTNYIIFHAHTHTHPLAYILQCVGVWVCVLSQLVKIYSKARRRSWSLVFLQKMRAMCSQPTGLRKTEPSTISFSHLQAVAFMLMGPSCAGEGFAQWVWTQGYGSCLQWRHCSITQTRHMSQESSFVLGVQA